MSCHSGREIFIKAFRQAIKSIKNTLMKAIDIRDITKSYGKVQALKPVSFQVEQGELFGLIGADGAGKSTLFRILCTLLLPDSGKASVMDFDVVEYYTRIRYLIGYMPGRFSLYQDLSVEENLSFYATVYGGDVKDHYDLIRDIYVQLEPFRTRPAGKLSGGMKQKLALCCALIHRPQVLFLDEPTTGVDAVSRKEFWDMLQALKSQGMTIMVSTPYMDEASLCERVALIQEGRILKVDTPAGIRESYRHPLYAVRSAEMPRLLKDLRTLAITDRCYIAGEFLHLVTHEPVSVQDLKLQLEDRFHHRQVEIEPVHADIEDCFIDLMQPDTVAEHA